MISEDLPLLFLLGLFSWQLRLLEARSCAGRQRLAHPPTLVPPPSSLLLLVPALNRLAPFVLCAA